MTDFIPIFIGIFTATYIANEKAKKIHQEEEEMTPYRQEDLFEDWEFKILRSINGAFKTHAKLQKVLHEEAQAGWVLLEKFDNDRIRLKRSIRDKDQGRYSGIDPYRSYIGMTERNLAWIIIRVLLGVLGLLIIINIFLRL